MERFASTRYGDFVRSNVEEKFNGNLHQTWLVFSHEATFIRHKLDALASKGVEVILRAESAHIRDAAAKYKNIVVLAHWKHERILNSDIRSPELLWRHMVGLDPSLQRLKLSVGDPDQLGEQLRGALDSLVTHGGSDLVAVPAGLANGQFPASVLRREALNSIPYLAPGNRLETWDTMMSAEQFSKLFGKGFEGTVLMAICNSFLLAEAFRALHPNAICICNKDTTNAGLNLTKLDAAVTLMGVKDISLWRALNQVGDIIDSIAT